MLGVFLSRSDDSGSTGIPARRAFGRHASKLAALGVILLFLSLGFWYSMVVPPFEAPDESSHYALARRVAQGLGFPPDDGGTWGQEAYQPPLYYAILGALTAGIDQSDFYTIHRPNPYANLGNPFFPGNKNRMLYSASPRPMRTTNLAVHIERWFSLLLGACTLLLVYGSARQVLPDSAEVPLLVLLTAAAIPQFVFVSTSITNDSLVILLCTAVIYWLLRIVVRPDDLPIAPWEWLVLGALFGLTLLTKAQGLALAVPIVVAISWLAAARRRPGLLLQALALVLLPALAIAGWWYWRNYLIHGQWLYYGTLNDRPRSLLGVWGSLPGELRGLRYSFWGLFGWFSIALPAWIYRLLDRLTLLAVAGLAFSGYAAWRHKSPPARGLVLLLFWLGVMILAVAYWMVAAQGGQGRLLMPAIGSIALALVLGCRFYTRFLPAYWRLPALALLPLGLFAVAIYVPAVLLPSAYAAQQPLAALPSAAKPAGLTSTNGIEIVGSEVPEGRFRTGDSVPITLYLRSKVRLSEDYPLFVQLLDDRRQVIGNVTTHPGWGRLPTSLWEPGAVYEDHYLVPSDAGIGGESPMRATVYAGFMDPVTKQPLPAASRATGGEPRLLGEVTILPGGRPDPATLELHASGATFGDALRLYGYRLPGGPLGAGSKLPVTLLWEAIGMPSSDYTAFVHLVDGSSRMVAGFDRPPAENRFPTHYWQPGDRALSTMEVSLPAGLAPGAYGVWLGLYPSGSPAGERLPVAGGTQPVQDRSIFLGTVQVR